MWWGKSVCTCAQMVQTDIDTKNTFAFPWMALRSVAGGSEKHQENEFVIYFHD